MVIEPENLKKMEGLFNESAQGHHLLFDHNAISQIFKKENSSNKDFFSIDNLQKVQNIIIELINKRSIFDKKTFLENLDPDSYELLVRTYFRILDATILAQSDFKH